ncbi:hypothetical protein CN140_26950 [Sinorhizobium meliloti]|uniref:hypothetical protein n=1 Tax=Rhizobium meliloti TaxID=382 RepID=UPI000FE11568|nr:hypothetical protein [Sinorhizobium meliloti]RVL77067.1 hypothetical protein CN140_26950 [Sinorhizobium meliloti]
MGAEEADDEFDEFAVQAFEEMALVIGVTKEQIEAEAAETTLPMQGNRICGTGMEHRRVCSRCDSVLFAIRFLEIGHMRKPCLPMGKGPHKKWMKAIARAVETVSPFKGTIALRTLGQAHAYIRNQHVHNLVNGKVRPLFENDEPTIVVSHSLGTIVSYALLREFARNKRPRQIPLWLTLGSPLGIDAVRKGFTNPRVRPANVARWVNGADPEDFVALRPALAAKDYGPDVENISDIENGWENPHNITAYLGDDRIAKAIADAIS